MIRSIGYASSGAMGVLLLGQVIPDVDPTLAWLKLAVEAGSTAVLGFLAIFSLIRVIPSLFAMVTTRLDEWEKLRHEDSERLSETLRGMTAQCAKRNVEDK